MRRRRRAEGADGRVAHHRQHVGERAIAQALGVSYRPRERKARPGTWTDERIVAALRDWFEEFGETPLSYEWSPRSADLLGLPRERGAEWMRQHPRWPSTATVCRHFDSWAAAVRAAGLPPARVIAPRRGLPERVDAARRLSDAGHGTAEIAALLDVSARTVRSYLRAGPCHVCGTPVITTAGLCPSCASRLANRSQWTRDQVIQAILDWVEEEGRPPSADDWAPGDDPERRWTREHPRWPSNVTVKTLFATWRKGIEAAGLRPRRRRWDRDAIIQAFRDFTAANGRPPATADLEGDALLPAPGTVRAHMGSLGAAVDAASRSG